MNTELPPVPDALALAGWRTSSYSGGNNGECLEVCDGHPTGVPVRDSKQGAGRLSFSPLAVGRLVSRLSAEPVLA
ncbi:DUF397 domain-containing protein [Streptomyces sp. NBRC 109706]|uniref:DUF397 domain-containing protein n=1 Tax=Streptomyces sp. NBRC 109706 TaxID=1550035 RepID=UPI00099CB2BC|nr:DUF397 domain-containing protein [Streptomyces sp. NBRC 109706]